jgi:hypothetical protein
LAASAPKHFLIAHHLAPAHGFGYQVGQAGHEAQLYDTADHRLQQ